MKNRIKICLLFALFLFIINGAAAQNEPVSFTLEEARQYAMQNSYVLQNSHKDVTKAQKEVWKTISTGLPQVSGSANYNMFLNLPVSLIPGEFFGEEPGTYIPVKFGQDYNSDFGFTVSQQIFDGSYIVGVGSSKIYLDLARQANEKTEINIREAVTQAYYMVLIGEENEKVMKENLLNVEQLFKETKAYFDNGFREELDVDQMQILVKNAENEILKAEREIKVARVVLKYTMGYDIDREITLENELNDFVDPLLEGKVNTNFDLTSHIDYRLANTNVLASEKLLKLQKVAFLPRLTSFYSYTKTAYGNKANLFQSDVSWFPSSLIGFQLTVPIFNSGQKLMDVQKANIDLEKSVNTRKLAETTLQKDYLTAVADMESALEKYDNDKENRALAEKILNKSKIKFNNGLTSSTELSQLETQYIQAYGSYIASTLQLLQAQVALKKAAGDL